MGAVIPAFGGLRPGGEGGFSLVPWQDVLAAPGIERSIWLSVKTGVIATFGAVVLSFLLVAGWYGTRFFRVIEQALSPLLAVPHVTAALALAFLIAPSGWGFRLLSPWLTGLERPADLLIVQDPGGWSLIAGLVAKEIPFLLLMQLAALPQAAPVERMKIAQATGYGRIVGFALAVFPGVYTQMRMPIYAALAYAMSNVDMAMVLGPSTPPTLAVLILDWMTDPDLTLRAPAAAAALLQLALVVGVLVLWRLSERLVARLGCMALWRGVRGASFVDPVARWLGLGAAAIVALALFGGLIANLLWSFAGRWRFPQGLPDTFKTRAWMQQGPEVLETAAGTLALALTVAAVALILVIGCLENEYRWGRSLGAGGLAVLYLPLILPQITFLPGLQILLLTAGADQGVLPVILMHLVFVLPYVFLSLAGAFRAWDARFGIAALALGASPLGVLWRVRMPMLTRPLLTALAVGVAVSLGQYLPTLLASGGRFTTLTTEALSIASGGDRRAIGVWATTLTLAAWAPFAVAVLVPRWVYRNRRGVLDA
ncbi:ABC transporter permease [Antarctobacter jejuensis]